MLHGSGADGGQAGAYNPLQAENSGFSDTSQGLPGLPEREPSSEAVLAEIFGGLGGTPSRSGRPPSAGRLTWSANNPCLYRGD